MVDAVEEVAKQDKRFASRKWRLALAVWAAGTLVWMVTPTLGILPIMATPEWIEFSKWVLGLYIAGNVGDTAAERLFDIFKVQLK